MPLLIRLILLSYAFLLTGIAYSQTTITLFADRDNTLYEDPAGALSNGVGFHFFSGRTNKSNGPALRRALLHFPIAAYLPSGATVTEVTLELNMSKARAGSGVSDHALHKVTADWGEGTSDSNNNEGGGANATIGDATWLHAFYDSDSWTTDGGDYATDVSAVQSVDTLGLYTWRGNGLVADVQSWVNDNSSNFGWILLGDEATQGSAKRFDSRENPDPANRPQLTITYTMGVGIEDQLLKASVRVFPNPTQDWVGIKVSGEAVAQPLSLRLTDLAGRTLKEEAFSMAGEELRWELPVLAPGNYLLVLRGERGQTVKKLLVH